VSFMDVAFNATGEILLEGARILASKDPNATSPYAMVGGNLFIFGSGDQQYQVWQFILTLILVLGLGSLAAGAGIGGGGLFVPLYAFLLGVGAKGAVPLSKATILGGALGNMWSIAGARHPDPTNNKPMIDYEAAAFMQSGELLGVVFGVLLNIVLPEILIIIFLAVLLSFNAYKTLMKGMQKYRAETAKMEKDQAAAGMAKAPTPEAVGNNGTNDLNNRDRGHSDMSNTSNVSHRSEDTEFAKQAVSPSVEDPPGTVSVTRSRSKAGQQSAELDAIVAEDAKQFPLWAWGLLIPMTAYTIVYALLKKFVFTICDQGPAAYWIWYWTPVPILGGFTVLVAWMLQKKHQRRVAAGFQYVGDGEENPPYKELMWTNDTLKKFPVIAVLAGVAAGLLGIGGGMVIGPLFIQLDMQPKVGSSTCAFMILWTAISGVIQYAVAGYLGWQFIIFGVLIGFISGQLGQRLVDAALKKTGRPSMVVFLLGGIVLAACVSMTISGIVKLIDATGKGEEIFTFSVAEFDVNNCP